MVPQTNGCESVPWAFAVDCVTLMIPLFLSAVDRRVRHLPALPITLIKRSDVVSRGAVVALPALDTSWLNVRDSSVVLIVGLAIVAVVALMVAAAAYSSDQRHKARASAEDDSELFTATPLPMATEELARMHKEARHHAFVPFRLPGWVQLGSVIVALGITYIAADRLRASDSPRQADTTADETRGGDDGAPAEDDSPESLDLRPAASIPFSFRVREFVATDGGCVGHLEVTRGADTALNLTARVHDDRGLVIDSARMPVQSLREGQVVEFRFSRASCERIGAWDVSGTARGK